MSTPHIYAIYDRSTHNDDGLDTVEAVLAAGIDWIQYRDKRGQGPDRALALRLSERCRAYDARLIINDDWRLAAELGVGVHLGATDGSIADARAALGPDRLIGATCGNDIDRARRAIAAGADHVSFGRFFVSATKPNAPPAELDVLARANALGVPVVAIGGIDIHNAGQIIAAGADRLAIAGGLFGVRDSAQAARALVALCAEHGSRAGR
ncbi:thiamine phosphate synthase [Salinisphaera sp. T31B1]|uniref:thiamine phosphate synthase n=1 Tax=Salinisphaera sp. T31B1 TaxID=727963 RepID=UPI0033413ACA